MYVNKNIVLDKYHNLKLLRKMVKVCNSDEMIQIPVFSKTNIGDFEVLKNGIDDKLHIIRHKITGFYNITQTAALVKKIDPSIKKATNFGYWFVNTNTKSFIDKCMKHTFHSSVKYDLEAGTPTKFKGIYVHELLYDRFMQWLSDDYALKVAIILKRVHDRANNEKDNKIEELLQENVKLTKEVLKMSKAHDSKIDKLQYSIDGLHANTTDISFNAAAEVDDAKKQYLTFISRKVPNTDKIECKIFRTQQTRVFSELRKYILKSGWELVIPPLYTGSSISAANSAITNIKNMIHDTIDVYNEKIVKKSAKTRADAVLKSLGMCIQTTKIIWKPNKYIDFECIITAFVDVIMDTQMQGIECLEIPEDMLNIINKRRDEYLEKMRTATGETAEKLKIIAAMYPNITERIEKFKNEYLSTDESDQEESEDEDTSESDSDSESDDE